MQLVRHHHPVALAIAFVIACGPGARPPGGTTPGSTTKQLAPLGIKEDAKAPSQALILGTDAKGGSTIIPLAGKDASVSVDAMFVITGGGNPASGGSSPVKLTTAPNPDGDVRVGIYEQFAGGAGPQWRAGVWISSFVAATTLGKDLTDFTFSAAAGGTIDGASASGLMTAGFLASLVGAPVDPKATMTGIINPDGSIGPVGGIPHKFLGSIEKGKTRLGYPIGQRFDEDMNTHQPVDLVALAKEHGATATEIADVYDAYTFLTGKTLPRPVPVDQSEMAVDDTVTAALDAKYADWQKMIASNLDHLVALYNERGLPDGLQQMALVAKQRLESAEKLRKEGLASAAYERIVEAWIYAAAATSTQEILELVQKHDIVGAQARLHELTELASQTEAALRTIGAIKPDTLGGHLRMIAAYRRAITGWGFHIFSSEVVGQTTQFLDSLTGVSQDDLNTPGAADQIVGSVAPSVLAIARAVSSTQTGVEGLDIESEKSVSYLCSLPNVRRLAKSYQSASAANLNYFETLFVKELAEHFKVPFEQAQTKFAMFEPDYLVATMAANMPTMGGLADSLKTEWGEDSIAWGLASLAGSELSFFKSSLLVSKWYSLGVETDEISGRPKSVEHEKAFIHMLDSADRSARENARAARVATGSIPIQARLAYQNAKVLREGDVADKLAALQAFWQSSTYSQTAVMLARN
ncbi:MAG: hypothetical protein K8W52_18625 [Deltaproteobacteria bacterium]|nr:hypothetical protein [Deltaproteobacteria bacterium]